LVDLAAHITSVPLRFRFADFVVSPARRQVLRAGREVPLIPRYFDLLVLLLERRGQAVHRRDILERVWNDVVVSDGAVSQAVRTLRRALGDDSQEPTFIRTVSRHGYRFDYPAVIEEPDPEPAAGTLPATALAVARPPSSRWVGAIGGAAAAGVVAGALGGLAVVLGPGAEAPASVPAVLALVGAVVGALGAAGVGAGLAMAETVTSSWRTAALLTLSTLGGGVIGTLTHFLARWTFLGIFGHEVVSVGGGWEGLALGAAGGLGHAVAVPPPGEPVTTRARLRAAAVTGAFCGLAGLLATAAGAHLAASSLQTVARTFQGSQVQLAPVARLLGEVELGPVTRNALALYEGAFFGFGLTLGFMRRPR
jgi:DNA-binding winged helix-turn-helix (wHTH) protein